MTQLHSTPALTWVIGRGGLLGQSVEKAMGEATDHRASGSEVGPGTHLWHSTEPIGWSAPGAGAVELRQQARDFLGVVGEQYTPVQNRECFRFLDALEFRKVPGNKG